MFAGEKMAVSNIIRGTMLLTAASFLSKFLGMIYVIPFNELVGHEGGALYQYAYIPYNILIAISTVGVPLAVSKFVSKYNSLGDYETGWRMFKAGTWLMLITGFLAFLFLFLFAPVLAGVFIPDDAAGTEAADVAFVIRMVSFALIVIPAMSIVRGYFQGHQSMGPTAVSQVVEQIVRIVFLLTGAFVVLYVFHGSIRMAVGLATFAAFVGAIASCVVLYIYWRRRKRHLDKQLESQKTHYNLSLKDLYKELFTYAGPFVLVSLATPLYQFIDQLTFKRAMLFIGQSDIADVALSNINLFGHKLVIIPITLATGMSLATLPAITQSFTEADKTKMFRQINQAFQIIMLLILPAAIGMSVLSREAWLAFYGPEYLELNHTLLAWYAPVALGFAFFTVSASILQGINKQQFTLISLFTGLLLKAVLNFPLIFLLGAKGAVVATMVAVAAAALLNLWKIRKSVQFSYRELLKRSALIAIFVAIMAITVTIILWILANVFSLSAADGRLAAVVILAIGVLAGGSVYLLLGYQSTLLERILGNRVNTILNRFRRR